jgi:hypothetical protein
MTAQSTKLLIHCMGWLSFTATTIIHTPLQCYKVYRTNPHTKEDWKQNIRREILKFLIKNFFRWIQTYLNDIDSVCMYRGSVFSTSYNTGYFILLLLWYDPWHILRKSCTTWHWVMQLHPGVGKWELHWSLSSHTLYNNKKDWQMWSPWTTSWETVVYFS